MPRSYKEWKRLEAQYFENAMNYQAYDIGEFVYYNLLPQDAETYRHPALAQYYSDAKSKLANVSFNRSMSNGQLIMSMAKAEAAKEQQMLNKIFNANINVKLESAEDVKMLIEAINQVFKFKSIFERNRAMLQDPNFKKETKAVFSYFDGYFSSTLTDFQPKIYSFISRRMLSNTAEEAAAAAEAALRYYMPQIKIKAVEKMFTTAKVELGTMDPQHQQAYKEIFEAIQSDFLNKRQNVFLDRLTEIYHLDDSMINRFKDSFSSKFAETGNKNGSMRSALASIRSYARGGDDRAKFSKGGFTMEALVDQAISMVVSGIDGTTTADGGKITAHYSKGIAQKNARADHVLTFGVDKSFLDKAANELEGSPDREKAVDFFTNLSKMVENVNDGFIVYFNDKNYMVGNNRGHSAGESINLDQLRGLLGGVLDNIDQLIYNLLQMGEGAIGAGQYTESTSQTLASAIAYVLFDDYSTIGNLPSGGGNSIHIFTLEGMMIPLSGFLYGFGKAMLDAANNLDKWVHVSISAPAIKFPQHGPARFENDNWAVQADAARAETMIHYTFLQNMLQFVHYYT